jgi:diaminopimelate decarboxylase/aspartate kinase
MSNPWVVLKYGGTSVSNLHNWTSILTRAKQCVSAGETPVIVCSAVSGISNKLETALAAALESKHEKAIEDIRSVHLTLANELKIDFSVIEDELAEAERIIRGVSLIGEISPQTKAKVMAKGELMSTLIGAEFLSANGLSTTWHDARNSLTSTTFKQSSQSQQYLSAICEFSLDDAVISDFKKIETSVIITQGFIARNPENCTVLLGRGGSDTSAAYFAGKLGASRLEIWTSVPGLFTANPHQVPSALLLNTLTYEEAQELASTGAKVLHPRCIEPAWMGSIPLHVRWTDRPEVPGTIISSDAPATSQIKALSTKVGIQVISMDSIGMWHEAGFLADIFQIFKEQGISIDQVATSETNVTVTLDPASNILDEKNFDILIDQLKSYCRPTRIGPCASLSLVGKNIRSNLHKLGNVLEVFEDKQIYILTQAASDLNITFTVAEEQIEKLLSAVHSLFFSEVSDIPQFGPSWAALNSMTQATKPEISAPWWKDKREKLLNAATKITPQYAYDVETIERRTDELLNMKSISRVNYAMKANSHPEILKILFNKGLSFDCVSLAEIEFLHKHIPGISGKNIVFTPNFAPISEYKSAFELGCHVNLDNLFPLEMHPEIFRNREILVRLDPGFAKGHHKHVQTAGYQSKFGVDLKELGKLSELATQNKVKIVGLHAHLGSGIKSPETWAETAYSLAQIAKDFRDVKILDLGGGFGVPERPDLAPLNLQDTDRYLNKFKSAYSNLDLWLEPGRFVVAEAGVLLAKVTQIKQKGPKMFIGLDAGMHNLIRSPLYGAYHHIVNLSRFTSEFEVTADVVGPICESGDVLGHDRKLPRSSEGDVFLIGTAGAYGQVMSSNYNLRGCAAEVLI